MPTWFGVAEIFTRLSVLSDPSIILCFKRTSCFLCNSCAFLLCEPSLNIAGIAWWLVYWTSTSGHMWFKTPLIKQQYMTLEEITQTAWWWRQTYGRTEEYRGTSIQSILAVFWSEKFFISLNLVAGGKVF